MSRILELEKELALEKYNKKRSEEDREMQSLVENYVGKCYGTNSFTQIRKGSYQVALSIDSIERYNEHKFATSKDTIVCTYRTINFNNGCDWMGSGTMVSQYSRGTYTQNLNGSEYNMHYYMNNLIDRKKEISVELFNTLYNCGNEIEAYIKTAFTSKLPLIVEKTIGDEGDQRKLLESYKHCNIEIIDLEDHLDLLQCLQYCKLPGYFNDRFLIKSYAKSALEYQIFKLNEDLNSKWITQNTRSHNLRQIKTINDHILKLDLQ